MKTCSYCGRQNDDGLENCFECGAALSLAPQAEILTVQGGLAICVYCGFENSARRSVCAACGNDLSPQEHPAEDMFLGEPGAADIRTVPTDSRFEHGFSYPEWDVINSFVPKTFPRDEWHRVYCEIARNWLRQLRQDLGGTYRCYESDEFFLLCGEGHAVSRTLLQYANGSLTAIEKRVGPIMLREVYGKRAILAFSDHDDYYAYISHFYSEGTHSLSAGIFIRAGYCHVAFPFSYVFSAKQIITHELVHNCLWHLAMPLWLNEGLSQRIERGITGRPFVLDREMAARHHAHWTEENIQEFWAGTSFGHPDTSELSYHLGEILVEVLSANWNQFLTFTCEADWRDAGQDSAQRILDRCLGEAIGGFLGGASWRPSRKAIATLAEQ